MATSRSATLLALTAAALGALGTSPNARAQAADAPRVDYRYTQYREADVPADRMANGRATPRYEIDSHQFRAAGGVGEAYGLSADLTFETMSGASPWFVVPGPGGRPQQVMSGASIEEKRTDLLLGLTRSRGGQLGGIAVGHSEEEDYRATNASLRYERELADTVTTLSLGAGHSYDELRPTQGSVTPNVDAADRTATSGFLGLSRVLGEVTAVQSTVNVTLHDGYLSDPYKQAWVNSLGNTVDDRRPTSRTQVSWLTRLRHFFRGPDAALHADYRYYHDDWEVDAHTVELAWHQRIGQNLRLVPGARWYSQSQAYFYQPYYNNARADGLASSDYRLSPYAAVSFSLDANVTIADWGANLRYEAYRSEPGAALGDVTLENPGLVEFDVVSVAIKKAF